MSIPIELQNHAEDMKLLPYIYNSSSLIMPDNVKGTDQSKSLIYSKRSNSIHYSKTFTYLLSELRVCKVQTNQRPNPAEYFI